ncbi:MAG: sugar ABC transporter permease [Crenarchaeota archaeon]|nr:sugar ABC transporter permease [Thermoproteota archaeon]
MPRVSDKQLALFLIVPLILFVATINIYPIAYSLWLSFNKINFVEGSSYYVGLANYFNISGDPFLRNSIFVSVRFVLVSTVLIIVISLITALVLAQSFRGQSILKVIVILPWALSEFAVAIAGRFFLDRNYGFLNAFLKNIGVVKEGINFLDATFAVEWLAIFFAWNVAPLGAYFILSAIQTIPEDLYKQARIDGASPIMRFRNVTFPFIRYAVLITGVLACILSTSSVVISFALTGGGPGMASTPVTLYNFRVFFYNQDYGYGAAISWVTLAAVLLLTIAYFRLLTRRR